MYAAVTDRGSRATALAGLYGITPDGLAIEALVARVDAAINGGARAIQYRDKHATPAARRSNAQALAALCRGRALFIVNDDAALAADVRADGVHVGEDDGSVAQARVLLGPAAMIGVSCYNELARASRAVAAGADYIAFGSFHPSLSKPAARTADVSLLAQSRDLGVPVVAIGGIDAHNAAALAAAGASAIAVITALFAPAQPAQVTLAAQALTAAFAQGRAARGDR